MPTDAPHDELSPDVATTLGTSVPQGQGAPAVATPWSLRDLILLLAFTPAALLAANLAVVTSYAILKPKMGWHLASETLQGNPFFLLALQIIFYALLLCYIYLLVAINRRKPFWRAVGWQKLTGRQVVICILIGFLMAAGIRFAPPILPDARSFPLERLFSSPSAAYAVGSFAVLVAPVMEEVLFRGVIFAVFEHLVGVRFAILGTAVLFAGLHVPEYWRAWNHVLMILLVGVVFSLARGMTGSLAPSVILHLSYNASMMAGIFIETQHFRALQTVFAPG